ncbi:MAG: AAA family ATPase [Verrucomicrobiae bacterium]|nr:AAA family ATPase [Verrucomicrobiae bacterium]
MDPDRIELLRNPDVFPEGGNSVEIIQTHLSVVCVVGDFAWKLKKAIRLPFADFSTLEKRKHYCEEELRLNRRLCPDTYLDVVPLRQRPDGAPVFCGESEGEIVDYAVRMKRLPANRMLDVLLGEGAVTEDDVVSIATRMVAFHHDADRGKETVRHGDPEKLWEFARENFEETRGQVGEEAEAIFPRALHAALESRNRSDFTRHRERLKARAASGHVIDGHGDLHARNICLTDPLAIYDCIEFEPAFRCGDVATEHAFLVMDLRFRGHPELASAYLNAVIAASGDAEMRALMPMLVRYRAMVRAKVSAIAAGEHELSTGDRSEAAESARRYLRLAAASAIEETGPWWLMLCGLPASGKSSLAEGLARASGGAWPIFSSDRIRKELAGIAPTEPLPEAFYATAFSRRTYETLRNRASTATDEAKVVVLDANFREREERARAREAAHKAGAKLAILQVHTDETIIVGRLDRRAGDPSVESDADHAVYRKLAAAFEPPDADEADRWMPVSGDTGAEQGGDAILAALIEH